MRQSKNLQGGLRLGDAKVAWLLPALGYGGGLLYHQPLLESLAARCGSFRVFTAEFAGAEKGLGFQVERRGVIKQFYQRKRLTDRTVEHYSGELKLITPSL